MKTDCKFKVVTQNVPKFSSLFLKVYSMKIKVGFPSLNNIFNLQWAHLSNFCDFIEI